MNLRLKFKKDKKKKFSKFSVWHYFLIITISTLLFVGIILFFYQYILGVSETNSSDVLQATSRQKLVASPVNKYYIEFRDMDGNLKSIRPKDCFGFDDVGNGITSSMKRTCRRNYMIGDVFPPKTSVSNPLGFRTSSGIVGSPTLAPNTPGSSGFIYPVSISYSGNVNNPYQHWWAFGNGNIFDGFYIGNRNTPSEFFSLGNEAGSDSQGYKNNPYLEKDRQTGQPFPLLTPAYWQAFKDTYIFREFNEGGNLINEPLPILTEYNGVPLMFYYGGVYEINRNNNTAYLITRLFDTYQYYSKACTSKNMPSAVYQVENAANSSYIFRSPIQLGVTEQYCKGCGYSDNYSKDCGLGITGIRCKQLGLGLNFPELFQDISNNSRGTPWWSDQLTCRKFNSVNSRYFTGPDLDQLVFKNAISGCDFYNTSCLSLGQQRVAIADKVTTSNINTAGAALGSVFNCIGFYEGDKCAELIESTVKQQVGNEYLKNYRRIAGSLSSLNSEPYTNNSFRESSSGNVRFVNCNNNSSCYNAFDLLTVNEGIGMLQKTRFYPFVGSKTYGYELPRGMFENTDNVKMRAVDYNENGKVMVYPSALNSGGRNEASSSNKKILNESEVDYFFSDDYYNYAIDLQGSSFKVYRFWVANDSNNTYFIDSTPSVNVPSNLAKKENITVTYSSQSRTIQQRASNSPPRTYTSEVFDILFSDKTSQSSAERKFYRFSSRKQDITANESGFLSEIIDNTTLLPAALDNKVILNLKRYPGAVQGIDNDYYVWVTPDLVYTSGVVPFTPPVCIIPQTTTSARVTNTSPNSSLTLTWPLSYSETQSGRLVMSIGNTNNTPITCNGQGISSAQITVARANNPSNSITVTGTVTVNPINNTLTFQAPANLRPFPSNMNYNITSLTLTFGTGNTPVVLTPTTHPNLFGTRGWDFYTENIVNITIQNSPTSFPLTVSVEKYRNQVLINPRYTNLKVNSTFSNVSSSIPNFYFDSEYPASANSLDNYFYDLCFASGINVSSFSSNNTVLELSANGPSCVRFRHRSNSQGASPINVTISLESSVGGSIGCDINGNLYIDNAGGVKMFPKPTNLKAQEGILFSNNSFSNSWSRYVTNTKFFPDFFQNSQTTLQGFIASSSLNLAASGSEFYLLTNPNSPVEGSGSAFPVSNYVTLSNPNSSTKDFHILAVSKGRGLRIDLTNSFLQTQKIDNFAFVNMTGKLGERIRFFADCSNPNYSFICGNQFKYIVKAPIYGSVLFEFRNAPTSSACRNIVFTENPDILMNLIPAIRNKKLNVVTSTPINITYLD